ncbi:MAG: hypothetical protein KKD44_28685 [Proteobacteria bacterium]|nr:hypothetical protein [Pseudomonadota bacterium]
MKGYERAIGRSFALHLSRFLRIVPARLILLLCGILLISGCAVVTTFYDGDGDELGKIKQTSAGEAQYRNKNAGIEMRVDTRNLSVYEKYFEPIMKSATRAAAVEVK